LFSPIRLTNALSGKSLKRRGLLFPGWGSGVTVPISINENPNEENSLKNSAFLSNPAASPTGLENFKPITSLSKHASFLLEKILLKAFLAPGILKKNFMRETTSL
jgi:hypothetical protein